MIATASLTESLTSAKSAGDEPLPGYRLMSPLGRGGFGEVWKCEAPGGLHKAIKFVPSDDANNSLHQEFEAFQQIKSIRHPFLLQLERVELTSDELIMVMELADNQLQERFLECRNGGQPGIPRNELLSYLADAAEALDVISVRHGLQHLDVKPANLFIICGRVKVGDYGLVRAESNSGGGTQRGFTPRYVAPEVLAGRVDARSDQYSLALVYQELLTGSFAYSAKNAQQMMMAHAAGKPDLASLPPDDRSAVAVALSKDPANRHPSCLAFIQALMMAGSASPRNDTLKPNDTAAIDTMRMSRVLTATDFLHRAPKTEAPPTPAPPVALPPAPPTPLAPASQVINPAASRPLPAPFGRAAAMPVSQPIINHDDPIELTPAARSVQLSDGMLRCVLPITTLTGQAAAPSVITGDWFVNALMTAALGNLDNLGRTPAGVWTFRFRSTHPLSVARHKLQELRSEEWFDEMNDREEHVLMRRYAKAGLLGRFSGKKAGVELDVLWPSVRGGEVELSAKLFGDPDSRFSAATAESMPRLFNEVRTLLVAGDERRKDPRVPAKFPATIYPLKDNGGILPAIAATCRNVSAGGLAVTSTQPMPTRYMFVEFPEIGPLNGLAVLTKMIRAQPNGAEHLFAGRFRTKL